MNIDLELYRIFYTVAKYENISKATEELYISQPAITQRINNLEKQLNIQLFYRKPSGMKLTKEGKQLFSYVKDSIETMNNVENKFDNYLHGECVGIGTHEELLKECEVYKEIALSQLSEEELNNG